MKFVNGDYGKAPLTKMFKIRRNFDRASPFVWIFLAFLILFVVGISSRFLEAFALIGGFVLFVFVLCLGVWLREELK